MTTNRNRPSFKLAICLLIIACFSFTPFYYRIPISIAAILSLLIMTFIDISYVKTKGFVFLVIYSAFVLYNVLKGDSFFYSTSIGFSDIWALLGTYILSFYFITDTNDQRQKYNILFYCLIVIYISVATALISIEYPSIVRNENAYLDDGQTSNLLRNLRMLGLTNYMLPHAIPVLFPGFVYCYKYIESRMIKNLILTAMIASILLVYNSGAFGVVVLSIISIMLSFVFCSSNTQNIKLKITFVFIILLVFALLDDLQLHLLQKIDQLLDNSGDFHEKIIELEARIGGDTNGGDIAERLKIANISWNGFFSNLLTGTQDDVGRHNSLLDRLATLGLLGFAPLVMYIINMYHNICKHLSTKSKKIYLLGFFTGIIMLYSKSSFSWDMFLCLFCILPSMLILTDRDIINS